MVLPKMAWRMVRSTDMKLLWKFAYNFGFKGMRSVQKFKKRLKKGEVFPPFLYISVTNTCNLRCKGCWVDVAHPPNHMSFEDMDRLVREAKSHGNSFFGLLGGEPFMHPDLIRLLEAHPDCYFQVFTNGQFITDEVAEQCRRVGNVTPLISIEGREIVSDERRGRKRVLNHTLKGLETCLRHKLITGVATSVCQTNIDLVDEAWLDELIDMGVHYAWFSHVPNCRARRLSRAGADARTGPSCTSLRRRDASQETDRVGGRLLERPRRGPLPGGDRNLAPYQSLGRRRTLPDRSVRYGQHSRQRWRYL